MKTLTVSQAKSRLAKLVDEVHSGRPVLLVHKNKLVKMERFDVFDPESESAELEAMLLEAVRGPHSPYSKRNLKDIANRIGTEKHEP